MITWNNLDTLESFKELSNVKKVNLVEAMTGENGAERVKNYSVPMAAGLAYNYAAKQVDDDVLEGLKKLAKEAFDLITFLTKGEYDQKLADETVGIPADTTNTEWPAMVECAKPVIEQSTNRFTWACGVESNVDMTPVIKENFIKLMAGSITADEFVSTMQDAAK